MQVLERAVRMMKAPANEGARDRVDSGDIPVTDFPEIDFAKSIMVGDSISDMEFGRALGMKTVFVAGKMEEAAAAAAMSFDARVDSLADFQRSMS